jgi:hypothetical protein
MSEDETAWDDAVARLADRSELHDAWLNGLAYNPAAAGLALQRILTANERLNHSTFWLEIRELTADAGATLARHPNRKVRLQLTQNPSLSLDALAALGKDPDRVVRMLALESIQQRDPELHRALAPERHGPSARDDAAPTPTPERAPLTRAEAQALVTSRDRGVRAHAAWTSGSRWISRSDWPTTPIPRCGSACPCAKNSQRSSARPSPMSSPTATTRCRAGSPD